MFWSTRILMMAGALAAWDAAAMIPPPELEAPGSPALQVCQAKNWVVFFDPGSAQLTPDARNVLANFLADPRRQVLLRLDVTGHTDGSGDPTANELLSMRRAGAVARALVLSGIPAGIIATRGAGAAEPAVPGSAGLTAAENRRVDIVPSVYEGC